LYRHLHQQGTALYSECRVAEVPTLMNSILFYYVYAPVILSQPDQYIHRSLFFNTFLFTY